MSDFLKLGTSSSSLADNEARKEAFKQNLHGELALASAQQLINTTNEKCYFKCVTKPSSSLSSSEEKCLGRCVDRYLEAFNIVSRTYAIRLSKEQSDHPPNDL